MKHTLVSEVYCRNMLQTRNMNGNVLYIFTECDKYRGSMKTSKAPPNDITTCRVQFTGVLVHQPYRKPK